MHNKVVISELSGILRENANAVFNDVINTYSTCCSAPGTLDTK